MVMPYQIAQMYSQMGQPTAQWTPNPLGVDPSIAGNAMGPQQVQQLAALLAPQVGGAGASAGSVVPGQGAGVGASLGAGSAFSPTAAGGPATAGDAEMEKGVANILEYIKALASPEGQKELGFVDKLKSALLSSTGQMAMGAAMGGMAPHFTQGPNKTNPFVNMMQGAMAGLKSGAATEAATSQQNIENMLAAYELQTKQITAEAAMKNAQASLADKGPVIMGMEGFNGLIASMPTPALQRIMKESGRLDTETGEVHIQRDVFKTIIQQTTKPTEQMQLLKAILGVDLSMATMVLSATLSNPRATEAERVEAKNLYFSQIASMGEGAIALATSIMGILNGQIPLGASQGDGAEQGGQGESGGSTTPEETANPPASPPVSPPADPAYFDWDLSP